MVIVLLSHPNPLPHRCWRWLSRRMIRMSVTSVHNRVSISQLETQSSLPMFDIRRVERRNAVKEKILAAEWRAKVRVMQTSFNGTVIHYLNGRRRRRRIMIHPIGISLTNGEWSYDFYYHRYSTIVKMNGKWKKRFRNELSRFINMIDASQPSDTHRANEHARPHAHAWSSASPRIRLIKPFYGFVSPPSSHPTSNPTLSTLFLQISRPLLLPFSMIVSVGFSWMVHRSESTHFGRGVFKLYRPYGFKYLLSTSSQW